MCGIAGAIVSGGPDVLPDPLRVVGGMVEALRHRGPDGRGSLECPPAACAPGTRVVLGHTRLAILDLSTRAAQPMCSKSGTAVLTYNGEIFNFTELRRALEACGRTFRTTSDTEVLLQGYEQWGATVVDRLRGMFAFAIWDASKGQLLLARDRLGIKPLYTYRRGGLFLFASEVRALLASGLVPRRLDARGLDLYLAHQTVPVPRTLIQDVDMVRPGHLLTLTAADGQLRDHEYWNILDSADRDAYADDVVRARDRVRTLLMESIDLHLVSDVPVGIFLSGGIDSSALVALTRERGFVPRTFSVVLPGSPHDEGKYASEIARHFGAEHHEIPLADAEIRDGLPHAIASVDHPTGDGLNTYLVAKAVREAGVTVALSGLGGDEFFGGYPSFKRLSRLSTLAPVWRRSPPAIRLAAASALRVMGRDSVASAKAAAVLESDGTVAQAFPRLRAMFNAGERRELLVGGDGRDGRGRRDADDYEDLLAATAARHPRVDTMSLVSYAEARTYMHDVLLRDTDQMSMAHGLEARVPLLDHRLVEYVMGLSERTKTPGRIQKRLLVESLGVDLPDACVTRPKQGFVLPLDVWMKNGLRPFCEHHLGEHGLGRRGFYHPEAVTAVWRAFLAGDPRTTWSRPWTLVALNAWIEANGLTA